MQRAMIMTAVLLASFPVGAQEKDVQVEKEVSLTQPTGSPYSGNWLAWPKLTGDWGGLRSELADMGITLECDVTQIIQQNAHGGVSTHNGFRYSGSADLTLSLDTAKLGLWKGGTIVLNAEPKWGDGVNSKVGSLLPVNYDAYKPATGEGCMMTLSEWFLWQELFNKKVAFFAGKVDAARVFDGNAFANDERTQFMNAGLRNNVMLGAFAPYTTMAAGIVLFPTDWLTIATAVADSDGRAKTTGFDTAFHGDASRISIAHEWAVKVKPFGLAGTQRVGFVWSGGDINHVHPVSPFRQMTPLLIKALGLNMVNKIAPLLPYNTSGDNVMVYYNFDQYLYTEANDPTQGIGLFGRFGWARQDVNPLAHFYSIGIGGKGIIPERDNDRFGLGYYYADLSNGLPPIFHSEQAIECYYNIEITPWLHITPDIQVVVNPGGIDANDVSFVWGLRTQITF